VDSANGVRNKDPPNAYTVPGYNAGRYGPQVCAMQSAWRKTVVQSGGGKKYSSMLRNDPEWNYGEMDGDLARAALGNVDRASVSRRGSLKAQA